MLRRVIEAAGGLVEQHQRRLGGQHDGEGEREALPLGEVAGMGPGVDARHEPVEHGPGGARGQVGVAVAGRALGGDGVVVEQQARVLGHEPGGAHDLAGRQRVRLPPADEHPAPARHLQPDEVREQGRLARAVAAHEGHDLARPELDVDVAQGGHRPVAGVQPLGPGHDLAPPTLVLADVAHRRRCGTHARTGRGGDEGGEAGAEVGGGPAGVAHRQRQRRPAGEAAELDHRRHDGGGGEDLGRLAADDGLARAHRTSTTRSAYCTTRSRRCSASSTVMPRSCTRRVRAASTSSAAAGSRAEVGSSSTSTRGPAVSTEPMATRCCWPPERAPSGRLRSSCRPSRSRTSSTRRRITSGATPRFSITWASSSSTTSVTNPAAGSCPTRPTTSASSRGGTSSVLRPSTHTRPWSVPPEKRGTRPLTARNRVDLPEPVVPTTRHSSPSGTTKSTSTRVGASASG